MLNAAEARDKLDNMFETSVAKIMKSIEHAVNNAIEKYNDQTIFYVSEYNDSVVENAISNLMDLGYNVEKLNWDDKNGFRSIRIRFK